MYELDKKQKIIIVIIVLIISIAFLTYIYTKDDGTIISDEEIIEENQIEENNETEKEEKSKIIVHISGAVNKEGIIELVENSRISDAINKAEGLKENADIKKINLAFKLEDGMKIYIPSIGEEIDKQEENTSNIDETSKYITSSSGVSQEIEGYEKDDSNENKTQKVNINTATQTELETLPGIGPSTSLKIVNYRKENGKFKSIEEIKEVSGIGDVKYENIKNLICVE